MGVCKAGFVVTSSGNSSNIHGPARPCDKGWISGEAVGGEKEDDSLHLHYHPKQGEGGDKEAEHLLPWTGGKDPGVTGLKNLIHWAPGTPG